MISLRACLKKGIETRHGWFGDPPFGRFRTAPPKGWTPNLVLTQVVRVLCLALGLLRCPASHAADWPRLGGPDATGVSPETGLSRNWPTNGPAVLWSAEVGEGFAGPAICQGEVFLLDRVPSQRDVVRCFDLGTGKELWTVA